MHESGEMYLESIFVLSKERDVVRSIDVCEYMGYSKPSVSRAVGILKKEGHIVVDGNGSGDLSDVDSFFASTQIERQRSRDEAIEVLQLVVENPEALDESKVVAMQEISKIASAIENEGKIESLVTAKGFDKCIAVISDSGCNIIVKTSSALMPNQVAQIQEIVYEQAGILPANTKIIEKIA